jgi:hypothetical protein
MTDYGTIDGWDQPRSGLFKVVVNAWWVTNAAGEPLFYGKQKAPQCNQNKWIAEQVAKGRPGSTSFKNRRQMETTSKILNGEAFCQMMETSFDDWFHREGVEQHCQAEGIYFDIGHYWDCVYKHRNLKQIEERPSGIVQQYSVSREYGSTYQVINQMPEFRFVK